MASDSLAARPALAAAMKMAGINGAQLAEEIGVSKQFISLLLRSLRHCTPERAAAIAAVLNSPTDALFCSAKLSEESNNSPEELMPPTALLPDDPYLLFDEAADYCRIKPKTLRHMRAQGDGPPFFRRGQRLMIRRSKLQQWFEQTYEGLDGEVVEHQGRTS